MDLMISFQCLIYIPILFILSILFCTKSNLSLKKCIVIVLMAMLVTTCSSFIVKGEYKFFVGGSTYMGSGYPYYFRFSYLRDFSFGLPTNLYNSLKPGEKILDTSVLISTPINFVSDVVFWFFIFSGIYFFHYKFKKTIKRN